MSRWPKIRRLPKVDVSRELGYWSAEHDCVVLRSTEVTGEVIAYTSADEFISTITSRRIMIFVKDLMDINEFAHLDELLKSRFVHPCVTRTGSVPLLYIKRRYASHIIMRSTWDGDIYHRPDFKFLDTMSRVFEVNGRIASTPGALGERKIIETLPRDEEGNICKYNRPSTMLRTKLLENKIGGRADTLESRREYGVLYEEDINSAYPYCSQLTIDPSETPKTFGSSDSLVDDKFLSKFYSYYAEIDFTLPLGVPPPRFGPLPLRGDDGHLFYPVDTGKLYHGWYFKEEIDIARNLGYEVLVFRGWGWRKSSNWLSEWANKMYSLKVSLSSEPAVQGIVKREMVAAIGRFGMAPETLKLVSEDEYRKGDLPIVIQGAGAEDQKTSKWFIRVEPNPEANNLTHINAYIVMRCRVELLQRMLEEESSGNRIVASNYDAYYTASSSTLTERRGKGLGEWKSHTISKAYIYGSRSIKGIRDGVVIDHRPGVPLNKRDTPKDTS